MQRLLTCVSLILMASLVVVDCISITHFLPFRALPPSAYGDAASRDRRRVTSLLHQLVAGSTPSTAGVLPRVAAVGRSLEAKAQQRRRAMTLGSRLEPPAGDGLRIRPGVKAMRYGR